MAGNEKKSSELVSFPSFPRLLSSLSASIAAKHFSASYHRDDYCSCERKFGSEPQRYAEQRKNQINKQTHMGETMWRFSRVKNATSRIKSYINIHSAFNLENVNLDTHSPSLKYLCVLILREATSNKSNQA